MKRIFLTLLISCICISFANAQETAQVFPSQGLQTFMGLDDTSSPPIVKDGRAADIQNIDLDITGAASKRNGYSLYGVTLDTNFVTNNYEAITGLRELYKSDGTRTKLAICGANAYKITATSATDITSAITVTEGRNNQFTWVTALDTAIATNDVDVPIKCTDTVCSALDVSDLSDTLTKAKTLAWWKNYLVLGNTLENSIERSTRVRWSNVGTTETWSDDDYIDTATLGGQEITAIANLYDDLIIFFTDSIYKASLVGGDDLILVTRVSEGVGCVAKNSVKTVAVGNTEGVIFLSRDKTINYFDGVKVQEISTLIDGTMDDLNASRLQYAVADDDRSNFHYHLAVTTGSSTTNNLILDFNYRIGEWSKHIQMDANAFMRADDDNNVVQTYFGNYKSFVYQMNNVDLDSDIAGETGILDSADVMDSATESGLTVLYDTSADFTDVTGATVRITSGTGSGTESVIVETTSSGIVVSPSSTATTDSVYTIGDIDAYYTTKWYDFGSAARRKNYNELFLWTDTDTSLTMQIYHATDFASTIESEDVTLQADGSLWGTAIWGTDTWAGSSSAMSRVPVNTSGRFIKFKFSEGDIDEAMDLLGYSIVYNPLDVY